MSLGTKKQKADHRYYTKHKQAMLEKSREWKTLHPTYMQEYLKKYYADNKEKLDAKNKQWALEHPLENSVVKRRNYTKNRKVYRQRQRYLQLEKRLNLFDILGGRKCVRCGYSEDTRALTFHHVRDDGLEDRKIHDRQSQLYSFYLRNPDLAKANLQVLCCNCNAIEKYNTMGFKILK